MGKQQKKAKIVKKGDIRKRPVSGLTHDFLLAMKNKVDGLNDGLRPYVRTF